MPREKRAAQFAPFDALAGMREALAMVDYEHDKQQKGDISEKTAMKISGIFAELEKDTVVRVKYFDDGYEKEYQGRISLDIFNQKMKLVNDKKTIMLDNLLDLDFVS